jgi:integrase
LLAGCIACSSSLESKPDTSSNTPEGGNLLGAGAGVYPKLGDKAVAAITLDDCLDVMRALPKSASRSRVHVASTIARLFKLAVFPMRIVDRSPLPEGFSPRRPARKAMAWLYPDEDRRLMACTAVPLEFRMLWGVLDREGMRASEVRALTWADLDLKRGMVKLDRNKTDDPRSWALDAGVHAALV